MGEKDDQHEADPQQRQGRRIPNLRIDDLDTLRAALNRSHADPEEAKRMASDVVGRIMAREDIKTMIKESVQEWLTETLKECRGEFLSRLFVILLGGLVLFLIYINLFKRL